MPWDSTELLRRAAAAADPGVINMDLIVDHIRTERPDIPDVYVEMSGGGCATIYVGVAYCLDKDGHLIPGANMYAEDPRIRDICTPVLAGPGGYGYGHEPSTGHREEFSIGYDGNDPEFAEDEGYSDWLSDPVTERDMARLMVRLYDKHPRRVRKEIP